MLGAIKIEASGGADNGMVDWKSPNKLARLGDSEDVALFANLTKDAAFPKRMGLPNEYALLVKGIAENPMLNGSCIRLDAGVRFSPK